MFKNLNLAPLAVLIGASNAAYSWNSTGKLFCYAYGCNYDANGDSTSYYASSGSLSWWKETPASSISCKSTSSKCSKG